MPVIHCILILITTPTTLNTLPCDCVISFRAKKNSSNEANYMQPKFKASQFQRQNILQLNTSTSTYLGPKPGRTPYLLTLSKHFCLASHGS